MNFITENLDQAGSLVQAAANALPATLSSSVGNIVGQNGNNKAVNALSNLLTNNGIVGPNGSLLKQQSAFPYKKMVTFFLRDRSHNLIQPSDKNFRPGYQFTMRINPSNFNVTLPPKTVVPIRTLGGWKLQYWYPELGSIKADGTIGNMLEAFNRDLKDSAAWRNFTSLVKVYTQNGIPYTAPGTANRRLAQNAFAPIAVCVFDKNQYEGYFESLDYTESEETPHTIKYSFNFKFVNNLDLGDIPGMTRESSIDASLLNAFVPQGAINNAVNTLHF